MAPRSKLMSCIQCGTQVMVRPHRWKTFRYCSRKCLWAWKNANERIQKSCQICGKPFSVIAFREKTAKYCSRHCYYKAMNGKGSVELQCVVCGAIFRRPPSQAIYANPVCDKTCRGLLMRTEKPGSASTARAWLARRNILMKCNRCGYDAVPQILVIHHRDEDRSNNAVVNLEILCPNCHALEHYKDGNKNFVISTG